MAEMFASGAKALAICDVCGFETKLGRLRKVTVRGIVTEVKACNTCWDPDHPQNQELPPIVDPQAVRDPRRDNTYLASGTNSLGFQGEGSRVIQWGWAPVGGGVSASLAPNLLIGSTEVGTVTVTTS